MNSYEIIASVVVAVFFLVSVVVVSLVLYIKSKRVSGIPREVNYRWEPVVIGGEEYETKIKISSFGKETGWCVSFFKDQTGGYMAAKTCKELIAVLESKFNIKSVGDQIEALIKNGNLRKKHKGE
jgi:hypothetical protein